MLLSPQLRFAPVKTSDSIEEQSERKAARDNGETPLANTQPSKRKNGDFNRIARWAWKPGQSGNPSGRPKRDMAAEVARAIFENNSEMIYKAYCKAVAKGNAYAFKELADRAYGKMKESIQHEVTRYQAANEQEINERIRELEHKLGFPEPKILPPEDPKPN
jgi:hypothetical protein